MGSAVRLYKPKPVKTAVTLLGIALALALVMLGLDYASMHSGRSIRGSLMARWRC